MRSSAPFSLVVLLLAPTALSQLLLPKLFRKITDKVDSHRQEPIMNIPNILIPPSKDDDGSSGGFDGLSISDVIGKERVINIFAGFTRDIDSISKRLNDNTQNMTVLAPLNSAVQKLPRKPYVPTNLSWTAVTYLNLSNMYRKRALLTATHADGKTLKITTQWARRLTRVRVGRTEPREI